MAWQTWKINERMCLTCQHFVVSRRLVSKGGQLWIEYDNPRGSCGIFHNFGKTWNEKLTRVSWCHYVRWNELP